MSYYFTNDDKLKSKITKIDVKIKQFPFSFYTDNGVFSKKGLDYGTRSLLEVLPQIKGSVLDLGCGYGPIGIYISKMNNISVDMIDINERSLNLAIENASLNKVDVNIFKSDGYNNVNKKYDYIVTNPPIRVGKKILYNLLFEAKNHLNVNGKLYLVIHKDQGAKALINDLTEKYEVNLLDKNKGFHIIEAINSKK